MNDKEKITEVEAALDGKITYTQLEQAKIKLREVEVECERLTEEFYKASRIRDEAEEKRNIASQVVRTARNEFDTLVSKWKHQ